MSSNEWKQADDELNTYLNIYKLLNVFLHTFRFQHHRPIFKCHQIIFLTRPAIFIRDHVIII